jgi:hypothetical protein
MLVVAVLLIPYAHSVQGNYEEAAKDSTQYSNF